MLSGSTTTRPAALALLLVASLACRERADRPTPGDEDHAPAGEDPAPAGYAACGRIAFASEASGAVTVEAMPAAGGASVALLANEGPSNFPAAVSPDGATLLILQSTPTQAGTTRDRLLRLDLAQPEATAIALTDGSPLDGTMLRNPTWSPDGRWVVVESDADGFRDLYRLEVPSGATVQLTDDPEGNFQPDVSPSGRAIAFVSSRDGNAELYRMSTDGGDPRRLTEQPGDDSSPRWSPDERWLAFVSARAPERGLDVHLLEVEGDGPPRPSIAEGRDEPVVVRDLVWSPDGAHLAFAEVRSRTGTAELRVVRVADGRTIARSRPDAGEVDQQPSWAHDGDALAFARGHGEQSDLLILPLAEAARPLLVGGNYWLPRWLPDDCSRAAAPDRPPVEQGRG